MFSTFQIRDASNKFATLLAVLLTSVLGSCVTVNVPIVFPESSVQKATDDFVRDIYRAKEKGKASDESEQTQPKKEKKDPETNKTRMELHLFNQAYAAEAIFQVESPKASRIRESLSSRVSDVIQQKKTGVLGEGSDGFLVIKTPEKLKDLLRKKVERLVKEENSDREKLYEEVAKLNGIPGRVKDVKKSFARSFQAHSPTGTWVQDSVGGWSQKP